MTSGMVLRNPPHGHAVPKHPVAPVREGIVVRFKLPSGRDDATGDEHLVHARRGRQAAHLRKSLAQNFPRERLHRPVAAAGDQVHREHAAGSHRPLEMGQQFRIPRLRAEDVGLAGEVDVVENHVEFAAVSRQPRVGVGGVNLDVERAEVHVFAGEIDDFRIDVDGGQLAVRQQMAEHAVGGAAGQAEHQHRARRTVFAKQRGGGDEVPGEAGEKALPVE